MLNYLSLFSTQCSFATRMTKGFLRYFLSLSILLLSVYSNLYAYTNQDCICHSSQKTFVRSEHAARISSLHNSQALKLKSTLYGTEAEHCKIVAAEIELEEDESVSLKKALEISDFFTAIFYAQALAYLLNYLKKVLAFCKHFAYTSSHRWYLLFRVFRI